MPKDFNRGSVFTVAELNTQVFSAVHRNDEVRLSFLAKARREAAELKKLAFVIFFFFLTNSGSLILEVNAEHQAPSEVDTASC